MTFGPSPDNPLGIFYCSSSIVLNDDVTIIGTLVSTGLVTLAGDDIRISGFNWRGEEGRATVANINNWPRLPAVVAYSFSMNRDVQAVVGGAVVVRTTFRGAGGDFEFVDAPDVLLQGSATSRPLQQPWSLVQLEGSPDLSRLNGDGDYSIWLDDGPTGNWHEIVGVDPTGRTLTVLGEVEHRSPTSFRVRPTRRRYVDIRGPVSAEKADINCPPAWEALSDGQWNKLYDIWEIANDDRVDNQLDPIPFVDWLADPENFSGWSDLYRQYGLSLEPTFHLRNTKGVTYQWSPPLFRAYNATGSEQPFAGYRWKVISWREVP